MTVAIYPARVNDSTITGLVSERIFSDADSAMPSI